MMFSLVYGHGVPNDVLWTESYQPIIRMDIINTKASLSQLH